MIVRDEAHVVEECLVSVVDIVDHWVVVDTGSVDDTPAIVERFFATHRVPGTLHHRPWRDFGTNRSEALDLARGEADYAFVMDADDVLDGRPDLSSLSADAYLFPMSEGIEFWRALLLRLDRPWRYEGVVHEYPTCGDEPVDVRRIEGEVRVRARRLGARNADPDKYRRDAELLEAVVTDDPDDTRATFYLAQSWFDAGEHRAALRWYRRRAEMGGWDEEVFVSRYRIAQALERSGAPWAEVQAALLAAWEQRPTRAEPLVDLARHHRLAGEHHQAHLFARQAAALPYPEDDLLFVGAHAHRWQALDELAVSAFYTGRHEEAFALSSRLLDGPHLPDSEWDRVLANRDFTVDAVRPSTLVRPEAVVEWLTDRGPDPEPEVTFTITTCRRPHLFEATMHSFLNCCADLDRIGRWLAVDDGSDPDDRAWMAERFPFLEWVEKAPDEAGHPGSMEALRREVTSPWWLHLEDDWHFVVPCRYVERTLDVLAAEPELGQVLLNRNYGEVMDDRRLVGGEPARTSTGRRYRRHVHHRAGPELEAYLASLGPDGRTNAWWPHFSLRPSMLRTAAMTEVGAFSATTGHFELDHAQRYTAAGWQSAFLDQVVAIHTGPRTTDRGPDREANAYDLAERVQFREAADEMTRVAVVPDWTTPDALVAQWSRQSRTGDGRWGSVTLVAHPATADLTLVLNQPLGGGPMADPARTVVAPMEPLVAQRRWSVDERRSMLQVRGHDRFGNLWEWHLGRTWAQLGPAPDKPADLSAVVSGRRATWAQQRRLDLVHHLQAGGVPVDVYGRSEDEGFADHCGPLPDLDKADGLLPYRYTIAVENHAEPGYVTEKLVDAVLAECLAFYWGAPDVADHVDPEAFVVLPLDDLDEARRLIRSTVADDTWARRIGAVRAEKRRLLDEAQLLPTLDRLARGWRLARSLPVRVLNLDRRPDRWAALNEHLDDVAPALAERLTRVPAVDGQALSRTPAIAERHVHNDFAWRRSVIGCAESHLALWEEAAEAELPTLVLEDDVRSHVGAWGELVEALGLLVAHHPGFDLGFLGFAPWPGRPPRHRPEATGRIGWQPVPWAEYQGGTSSYVISPTGAARLVRAVGERGMVTAVDEFLRRTADELSLEVLELHPHLFRAEVHGPDSDVQHDHTPL